jgi:hypothetical protein
MKVQYLENGDLAIFNEMRFRRDKKTGYYLNSTIHERLHVYIWEYYNGEIPKGYNVHHKKSKDNNDIEDLQLLTKKEHIELHKEIETEERKKQKRENFNRNARPKAIEWHKSEEGREWHKKHYKDFENKLHTKYMKICECCNRKYETIQINSRFCSDKCKSRWRRKQGVDNEKRICIHCGKEFEINKYSKTLTCSRSCASKKAYQNRIKK